MLLKPIAQSGADTDRPARQAPTWCAGGADARLALVVGLYHFGLAYALVFLNGLCCADDAAFAVVAKNLSLGHGYATSLQVAGAPGLHPFDFGITTGPTLLLPAAVAIAALGNRTWIPGLVAATLSLGLLLVLLHWLRVSRGPVLGGAFACLLLLLLHGLTASHFEQWYAFLGEIPAALLSVLALYHFSSGARSNRRLIEVGLLGGLAVMAKVLALLGWVPIGAVLLLAVIRDRGRRPARARELGLAAGALLALPAAFELWRLLSLGTPGYLESLRQFTAYVQIGGIVSDMGVPARVVAHARQFRQHFGFWPLSALAFAGLSLAVLARSPGRCLLPPAIALYSASFVHFTWWLTVSTGRPRYVLIGLVLYAAGLALVVHGLPRRGLRLAAVALIAAAHVPSGQALTYPLKPLRTASWRRLTSLRETVKFLQSRRATALLVAGSWTTVAELEYALPGIDNFRRLDHVSPADIKGEMLLVRNVRWRDFVTWSDAEEWEKSCAEVIFDRPPFLVSRCPFEKTRYDRLSLALAHVLDPQHPVPAIRLRGGRVADLSAPAPATLALEVPAAEGARRLRLGYGIDEDLWGKPTSDGVCFVVSGESPAGDRRELLNDCIDTQRPGDRGGRTRVLPVPAGISRLILQTQPRANNAWDWSYWSEIDLEPHR